MQTDRRRLSIYAVAGLVSLLLSAWAWWQAPYINQDGVHYLRAAAGDPDALAWIGHWSFYSYLIGLMAGMGLDPYLAAQCLNALFDLIVVLALVRLVDRLTKRPGAMIWGALLILTLPYFNDNRAQIIRDHGYWAFSLLALVAWSRLLADFQWRHLLAWNLWMALATLFRVEGLAFLFLMPLGLLWGPEPRALHWKRFTAALVPVVLLALAAWPWLDRMPDNRLAQWMHQGYRPVVEAGAQLAKTAAGFHRLLPDLPDGGGWLLLVLAMVLSIVKDLGDALSWPLAATLLVLPRPPHSGADDYRRRILPTYALISFLVLLAQEARALVMVSRYTMALALAILPVAALLLDHWWQRRRQTPFWQTLLVALTLTWMAGDSLVNRATPKPWLDTAAHWAADHLPPGSRILTDYQPIRLAWYAKRFGARDLNFERYRGAATPWRRYDYLFVRRPTSGLAMLARRLHAQPVARLGTVERGLVIYDLRPEKRRPGTKGLEP